MAEHHCEHGDGAPNIDSYVYSSLEHSDSLRLIKIINTEPLECEIQHHGLKSASLPEYSALSYAWGDPTDRVSITCNNKPLLITRTLQEALPHVAQHNPFSFLWVDQICINQLDNEERAQQLKIMAVIFQASDLVTAWLGSADDSETMALGVDQVQKVARVAEALDEDELPQSEDISITESEELAISFKDVARWHAFSKFFDRPWFQRIWIVQEMLPAQDQEASRKIEAQVVVGPHVLSWDDVKLAATWSCYKGENRPKLEGVEVDGISLTVSMRLRWATRFARMYGRLNSVGRFHFRTLSLLDKFRNRLATDPKDKVYALLGISDLDSGYELELQSLVPIDYTKSVLQVFRDTTRAVIEHSNDLGKGKSLDILISATPPSEEEGWPTWVPDWRITDTADAGVRLLPARPAGDIPLRVLEPPDENALKVAGVVIGTTCYVHTERHVGDILWQADCRALQQRFIDMLSTSTYLNGEDVATAFTLTLSAGRIPNSVEEAGTTTEAYANSILDFIEALKLPRNTEDEKTHRYAKLFPFKDLGFDTDWVNIYTQTCCERRLFTTDSGYLGLGNHHMVAGDVIAILFGLHVPCVLRPLSDNPEDGYAFIGDAYVHGAMNGEAVKDLPKGTDGLVTGDEILLR